MNLSIKNKRRESIIKNRNKWDKIFRWSKILRLSKKWQKHGQGIMILWSGTKIFGEFEESEISYGKIKYPKGNLYEGEIRNWTPNGKGLFYDKQPTFDGYFKGF